MFNLLENKFILKLSHMYTNTAEAEKFLLLATRNNLKKNRPQLVYQLAQ